MYKRRGGAGGEAAADARYAYRASCPYLFMVLGGGCAIGADSWRGGGSESMYVRGVGVDGQPGTRTAAHLRRRLGDKDEMRTREACETWRRVQLAGKLAGLIPSREPKRCGRGRRQPASSVMRHPPAHPPSRWAGEVAGGAEQGGDDDATRVPAPLPTTSVDFKTLFDRYNPCNACWCRPAASLCRGTCAQPARVGSRRRSVAVAGALAVLLYECRQRRRGCCSVSAA